MANPNVWQAGCNTGETTGGHHSAPVAAHQSFTMMKYAVDQLFLSAPANPVPPLRGFMARILLAVQVAARRRQRSVPKVVAHEAQVDLLVGHERPGGVAQLVRRGAGQYRSLRFPFWAARPQAPRGHAKHLFPDQVQRTA